MINKSMVGRFWQYTTVILMAAMANPVISAEEALIPNFEVGGSLGMLSNEQLHGLDVTINMPLSNYLTTQVSVNSDYAITQPSSNGYSQSELIGNAFVRNVQGKFGLGLGYQEKKLNDATQAKGSTSIVRVFIDLYLKKFTLIAKATEYEERISTTASSSFGLAYYANDEHRLSLIRQRRTIGDVWQFEAVFQPEEYQQQGSLGIQIQQAPDSIYWGLLANFYFDTRMTLKQRYRHYH